ncbi:hypothetical protein SARC_12578 [Sphaeroforma arctica JP610]|uniref:Uncharacterized protein n=1 Tax=Sphaeroforma arctica JP610 TaxID=667725 RepID=A0A0L0FDQ1_9EUKA|nr:hypothetical protein SARC_12578 [Sphaeroforma arctica JP610]KNC74885.1 hypothetical protein SARC_12578 [Sphaeroforma arctica JP610]|eukprot:XP_014148787.1 hypothetical protein SARC_12578 [Sphaeroforma arctica JP610]
MVFTQITLILCATLLLSGTSIARRQAESDYNEIFNTYNYPLTWSGRYLEWKGYNAETLQFTSFPAMDSSSEFKTADGICLILATTNGFSTVEIGACNGQLFTPVSTTNELRNENPPIGVCAEEDSLQYFKACPSTESGELCLGENEGYASVRPCSGYVAKLLIQNFDEGDKPKPTEVTEAKGSGTKYSCADVIWYVNVVDEYFNPAASKQYPVFQRLACVQVSDSKWYATETIQHGKTCIANTDRSACKEYNTVLNCRTAQYNTENIMKYNGPDFNLIREGAMCL